LGPGLETQLNVNCGLPRAPISEWLGCTDWAISKLIRTAQELDRPDRTFRDKVHYIRQSLRQPPYTGVKLGFPIWPQL
jgi:hypothetical protein